MLRHSTPFGALEELAKGAYVEVAMNETVIPDSTACVSFSLPGANS